VTVSSRIAAVAALAGLALFVFVAAAGAGGPTRLKTFGTGEVTTSGTSATIVIDAGEASGVYAGGSKGKLLGQSTFTFTSRGDVVGGAPRFSIPINDGAFDPNTDYAFLDASNCGATEGDNPGNVATLVSTQNPACHVNFHGTNYTNWTTFAQTNPTFRVAKGWIPFIIADAVPPAQTSATYVVTDVFFGG
jgi:hypothetical protein